MGRPARRKPHCTVNAFYRHQASKRELDPAVKTLLSHEVGSYTIGLQTVAETVPANTVTDQLPPAVDDPTPECLKPGMVTFEVSTDMQLDVSEDQTCALTPGDILFRKSSAPDTFGRLQVVVVAAPNPGDCAVNTTAMVSIETLEEINNEFQQQLQSGMDLLAGRNR